MERNFEHIEPGNQGIPPSSEESFKIPDSGLEAEPSLSDQLEGIVQKYLKELIKDFQSKAMSWSEYCNLVYDAEEEFLKNPDYSEEIKKMGRLLFMSAVVIESAFARNRKTKISPVSKEEEFKRNPALREAKWFIEMARHYYYEPMGIEDGHGAKAKKQGRLQDVLLGRIVLQQTVAENILPSQLMVSVALSVMVARNLGHLVMHFRDLSLYLL